MGVRGGEYLTNNFFFEDEREGWRCDEYAEAQTIVQCMYLQNDVSGAGWVDVSRSGTESRSAPLKLVRNGEKKCNLKV